MVGVTSRWRTPDCLADSLDGRFFQVAVLWTGVRRTEPAPTMRELEARRRGWLQRGTGAG